METKSVLLQKLEDRSLVFFRGAYPNFLSQSLSAAMFDRPRHLGDASIPNVVLVLSLLCFEHSNVAKFYFRV
jgi:hypothetical protein